MNHFGSISAVFDASIEELCSVPGVKENTAVLLKLIPDLAREYIQGKNASNFETLESMEEMIEYAKKQFASIKEQRVYGVMLDNGLHVVGGRPAPKLCQPRCRDSHPVFPHKGNQNRTPVRP